LISVIAAVSDNGVIGADGDLPWRLSADLRNFKAVTMGKPIVMGRKTWDSLGRPLPGRQNIIITRQSGFDADGCDVVPYPAKALTVADDSDEIMIIGGGQIYAMFLRRADRIYLTRVHTEIEGDAFFPELDEEQWQRVSAEHHEADDTNEYAFTFEVWDRQDHL